MLSPFFFLSQAANRFLIHVLGSFLAPFLQHHRNIFFSGQGFPEVLLFRFLSRGALIPSFLGGTPILLHFKECSHTHFDGGDRFVLALAIRILNCLKMSSFAQLDGLLQAEHISRRERKLCAVCLHLFSQFPVATCGYINL